MFMQSCLHNSSRHLRALAWISLPFCSRKSTILCATSLASRRPWSESGGSKGCKAKSPLETHAVLCHVAPMVSARLAWRTTPKHCTSATSGRRALRSKRSALGFSLGTSQRPCEPPISALEPRALSLQTSPNEAPPSRSVESRSSWAPNKQGPGAKLRQHRFGGKVHPSSRRSIGLERLSMMILKLTIVIVMTIMTHELSYYYRL